MKYSATAVLLVTSVCVALYGINTGMITPATGCLATKKMPFIQSGTMSRKSVFLNNLPTTGKCAKFNPLLVQQQQQQQQQRDEHRRRRVGSHDIGLTLQEFYETTCTEMEGEYDCFSLQKLDTTQEVTSITQVRYMGFAFEEKKMLPLSVSAHIDGSLYDGEYFKRHGREFGPRSEKQYKFMNPIIGRGPAGDERGHLIGAQLGGLGVFFNIAPQCTGVNRNYGAKTVWREQEDEVTDYSKVNSAPVEVTVYLHYNLTDLGNLNFRPDGFKYCIRYSAHDLVNHKTNWGPWTGINFNNEQGGPEPNPLKVVN